MAARPATIGQLRADGWESRPVKEEVRANAVARIAAGEPLFERVLGYEQTVLPQLENALLAGHDIIFLGERGQAKTRMIRSLTGLLDEWMPIIAGSEINDDPYAPVSRQAREFGDHGARRAARHLLQYRYRSHSNSITLSSSANGRKVDDDHDDHHRKPATAVRPS